MVLYKANKINILTIVIISFFVLSFFIFSFDNTYLNSNDKSLLMTQRDFYDSKDPSYFDGFLMENIHKDIKNIIAYELNAKYIPHTIVVSNRMSDVGLYLQSNEDECLPKIPAFDLVFHITCFLIYYRCRRWLHNCIRTITFHMQSMIACLHKRDGKKRRRLSFH